MIQKVAKVVSGDILKLSAGMNDEFFLGPSVIWGDAPRTFALTNMNDPINDLTIIGHYLNVLAQQVALKWAVKGDI